VTSFIYLLQHATKGVSVTGQAYVGIVCIAALTAICAPSAERRRDARAVLKLMLRSRNKDE
jgi:hypothetical protein